MEEVDVVKALSFECKICDVSNVKEFDKGDTATTCDNCLTKHKINIDK